MTNQAMHPFIPFQHEVEAHYVVACLNSSPFEFAVQGHTQRGGKSFAQPNILEALRIPGFAPQAPLHLRLAELSRRAHGATAAGNTAQVEAIDAEIDRLAAQLWGLTEEELREIQRNLAELR